MRPDPAVDDLVDQCTDLRVQISLLMDSNEVDDATLKKALTELNDLERRIARRRLMQSK